MPPAIPLALALACNLSDKTKKETIRQPSIKKHQTTTDKLSIIKCL